FVPAARFAPGFCFWLRATPTKGWRSAERRTDACEASVGPALSGQARHLARRLASPYGGRPPPGAHTVAIFGAGAALPLTGIGAGSVTATSHIRVVVPGGGPLPPGATVASRRRRTPRLAPPSGCLRTTPLDERGWECSRVGAQSSQYCSYNEFVITKCSWKVTPTHRRLREGKQTRRQVSTRLADTRKS